MNTTELFFFDAHGGLWATSDCNDGRAQAFGPTGCARPVLDGAELAELGFADDGDNNPTLYVRARDAGRVLHADADDPTSWDVLLEGDADDDPEPDTFTSGGMTAGEAWARWRAAAGIFGGTVPLYLPDAVPSALPDIAVAAARAVAAADEASGPGNMPVVGLDVELQPGSIRLSYGGGRTRAWVQIRLGVSDEASSWGVDVDASYSDLSGVDESVARRVAAGVAVEWAYSSSHGGRW